ncbi:MAG: peptide deformylase [Polyangiaceae bacterium]
MKVLDIAQIGEPVLRQLAQDLSKDELAKAETQTFIDDLVATMHHANGAGLAANQVFRPIRVCAIEVKDNPRYPYKPNIALTVLINPTIEPLSDERFDNYEGCLSVPNLRGVVSRHAEIRVWGLLRDGSAYDQQWRGLSAGTFQHEIDHLDGKLFVDRVTDPHTLCTWETFKRHHEAPFIARVKALVERYGS